MACQCASFCIQDPGLLGKKPLVVVCGVLFLKLLKMNVGRNRSLVTEMNLESRITSSTWVAFWVAGAILHLPNLSISRCTLRQRSCVLNDEPPLDDKTRTMTFLLNQGSAVVGLAWPSFRMVECVIQRDTPRTSSKYKPHTFQDKLNICNSFQKAKELFLPAFLVWLRPVFWWREGNFLKITFLWDIIPLPPYPPLPMLGG